MGAGSVEDQAEKASGPSSGKPAGSPEETHSPSNEAEREDEEHEYPKFQALILMLTALYLAMFLVALDRTIIGTAIPRITDTFHSIDDIGWYGSAYLLTAASFQLMFGRLYTFYSPKLVFLAVIGLFEVGSAICGAAPNSTSFIVGRAIAGLGSAGVFSGSVVIIMHSVVLHKRPLYVGFMGAIFAIASVAGPLLGGAFTDRISWRWCFYINLPIGGFASIIIILVLHLPSPKDSKTAREKILTLDPLGAFFFLPSIICLILALQWGGTTYAWSNARIIVLLILFAILLAIFVFIQISKRSKPDTATVPPEIFIQRSVLSGFWFSFFAGSSMMIQVYYLPIWFQAIKAASAVHSGVMVLPVVMGIVFATILAGSLVTMTGYYTPFMIASSVIQSVGAGMISTFTTHTDHPKWIAYQFLFGFGLGLGMQQTAVAVQTVLSKKNTPTGIALMFFSQSLGGAIFLPVAQNIFSNRLVSGLRELPDLNLDPETIVNTGATALRDVIGQKQQHMLSDVLEKYNWALRGVFDVGVGVAVATVVGSLGMEWRSVKAEEERRKQEEKGKSEKNEGKKEEKNENEKTGERGSEMNIEI